MRAKRNQSVKNTFVKQAVNYFYWFPKPSNATAIINPVLLTDLISGCTSSSLNCFSFTLLVPSKRFSQEHIKSGQPRRTTDRCPPNVLIWPNTGLKDRESSMAFIGNKRAQRHTASQSFTQEQYVWYDIKLFKSPEAAVSSEATLYLIQYQ